MQWQRGYAGNAGRQRGLQAAAKGVLKERSGWPLMAEEEMSRRFLFWTLNGLLNPIDNSDNDLVGEVLSDEILDKCG